MEKYLSDQKRGSLSDDVGLGLVEGAVQGILSGGVGGIWATPVLGLEGPLPGHS